jgi:hypothetical protein
MLGRPSKYSKKTAELICDLLGQGQSLLRICALEEMPERETVYAWLRENKDGFSDKYRRARELQQEFYFEHMQEIAFDESRDVTGELKMPNNVAVNRDKLKIQTLQWTLGRMNPGKYGDKLATEHSGSVGLQLIHSIPQPKREELDGNTAGYLDSGSSNPD